MNLIDEMIYCKSSTNLSSIKVSNKLMSNFKIPDINEETLKKLPNWKQWFYRTMKEIIEKVKKKSAL